MVLTVKGSEVEQTRENNCQYNFENDKSRSQIFITTVPGILETQDERIYNRQYSVLFLHGLHPKS